MKITPNSEEKKIKLDFDYFLLHVSKQCNKETSCLREGQLLMNELYKIKKTLYAYIADTVYDCFYTNIPEKLELTKEFLKQNWNNYD